MESVACMNDDRKHFNDSLSSPMKTFQVVHEEEEDQEISRRTEILDQLSSRSSLLETQVLTQ
jgi:hypothetical protein